MNWIADRSKLFDSSGIRRVFELARQLKDPINLSIGQPDFDVPQPIKDACQQAIAEGKNGYALSQGMPVLREKLQASVQAEYAHADRDVFVCSGTSGGLVLTMMALVNPGDEVILFDPFFVMYEPLVKLMGGTPVTLSTYPDFRIPVQQVEEAISPRTKMILFNSPANPTGVVARTEEVKALAELANQHNVALVSDEIYRSFCYDDSFVSPARYNERVIVIDGFSKSHAMTGWRLGFVHGPREIVNEMIKLQQYTFVCAPQPVQWAGAVAMDYDIQPHVHDYRQKRDRMVAGLRDHYEFAVPGGAFYLFPKLPWGTGDEFVRRAMEQNLLVIPGHIFSHADTHFRISYAASDEILDRGIDVLRNLAKSG